VSQLQRNLTRFWSPPPTTDEGLMARLPVPPVTVLARASALFCLPPVTVDIERSAVLPSPELTVAAFPVTYFRYKCDKAPARQPFPPYGYGTKNVRVHVVGREEGGN